MLVVAGETIVDMIARTDAPMCFDAHLGGGPYNVAKAASKMGQTTSYLSPLSSDYFGDAFAQEMKSLNVQTLSARSDASSGLAIVQTDKTGQPSYTFYRESSADRDISLGAMTQNFPKKAQVFYVGGLALVGKDDAEVWANFVASPSCTIFCDPNIRPSFIQDRDRYLARLERVYQACDIVKLSDEDIAWLAPFADPRDYVRTIMMNYNIRIVFLTMGSKGAEVFFENQSAFIASPRINVQDTVGAGDCFSAASIASIERSGGLQAQTLESLTTALRYAVTAAAINCMRAGANAPTDAEIDDYLKSL